MVFGVWWDFLRSASPPTCLMNSRGAPPRPWRHQLPFSSTFQIHPSSDLLVNWVNFQLHHILPWHHRSLDWSCRSPTFARPQEHRACHGHRFIRLRQERCLAGGGSPFVLCLSAGVGTREGEALASLFGGVVWRLGDLKKSIGGFGRQIWRLVTSCYIISQSVVHWTLWDVQNRGGPVRWFFFN